MPCEWPDPLEPSLGKDYMPKEGIEVCHAEAGQYYQQGADHGSLGGAEDSWSPRRRQTDVRERPNWRSCSPRAHPKYVLQVSRNGQSGHRRGQEGYRPLAPRATRGMTLRQHWGTTLE